MAAAGVQLQLYELDGAQHLAVADVTAMLRSFSRSWGGWVDAGHADLDPLHRRSARLRPGRLRGPARARPPPWPLLTRPDGEGALMPNKPGLTHHEHLRLAQVLAGIRDQLQHERVELLGAYPQHGPLSRPAQRLLAAMEAVNQARDALENQHFAEHPEHASTKAYYPLTEHRAQITVPVLPGPQLRVVKP
ncbi:hypothetical protein [Kitasatospora sp. NPDC048407]|uniref:hypothetical protein n=1 Tax=Kitasatospora sp. NPDC048407 TaxID=3364051 RepID=UPI003721968B